MAHGERPTVCYVLPHYDPATGSHFAYLYELLRIARADLDVFLIAERASVVPAGLVAEFHRMRFTWLPLRFLELLIMLGWQRLQGRRDFYTHYSFVGALAAWFVTALAGNRAYYWNCGLPWLYRRPRYAEAAFRFILRHSILVTGTEGLARAYARQYGLHSERIRVVPNWITVSRFAHVNRDDARHRLGISPDAKVALFVHRLSRRKGADRIPAIVAGVTKRVPHAMFLIVGDGPERKNVELKIQNSELAKVVRFVGEIPNRDVPAYLGAADIFFMPSEEEGFPHVLLEAMAAGLPYVASDVGGVREITPPALQPFLVSSGDDVRFTERISALLALTPEERTRISVEERAWVERYDLLQALPKFRALFK